MDVGQWEMGISTYKIFTDLGVHYTQQIGKSLSFRHISFFFMIIQYHVMQTVNEPWLT